MMNREPLYHLTATEIVHLINTHCVSVSEVTQEFIYRTSSINPMLRAWVSIDVNYIIEQANQIEKLLPENNSKSLIGVPIGIKDIFNTEFYPTQKGTPAWKGYHAGNDARCVARLRSEGAVIFGKTDTAELAVHANGKALNPYDLSHVTGSSSGGSAAAVASAMVPVALGSQTGGSIIRPASWCGVYAMKPSFGLIPRTGVLKTTDTLDTIGFFSRSVADLSLLLETMKVHGDNFPTQEQKIKSYSERMNGKKWRVAFCNHPIMDDVFSNVNEALGELKNDLQHVDGVEVLSLDLPKSTWHWGDLHRRIYHPCLAYYLKTELLKNPDEISDTLKSIFDDAAIIPPEDYKIALREQCALAEEMENFFLKNKIDFIILNSSNGSAPYGCEPEFHKDLNSLWTMCWLPVVNVPKFKCKEKMPFGFQVVGARYSDRNLMSFLKHLCQNRVIPEKSEVASLNLLNAVSID